jgi:hypothetical protein
MIKISNIFMHPFFCQQFLFYIVIIYHKWLDTWKILLKFKFDKKLMGNFGNNFSISKKSSQSFLWFLENNSKSEKNLQSFLRFMKNIFEIRKICFFWFSNFRKKNYFQFRIFHKFSKNIFPQMFRKFPQTENKKWTYLQ